MQRRVVSIQTNQEPWPALLEIREMRVGTHLKVHSVEREMKVLAVGGKTWLSGESRQDAKGGCKGGTELRHCQTLQSSQDSPHVLCTF